MLGWTLKYVLLLLCLWAGAGCTTLALKRHTLTQGASPTDIRFNEVLENLAMVAHDPFALPAFSSIFAGTAQITDTSQLISTTTVGPGAMSATAINPQFTRGVVGNWTLDPINAPEKLEAIRCACRWVVYGPEQACRDCPGILETPEQAPFPGRHFGVLDRMAKLPPGWLHIGPRCQVPITACYKARAGGTWVWVMPAGVKGLADFSLILQDIARVDINSPTIQFIRSSPSDFVFPTSPVKTPCCESPNVAKDAAVVSAVKVDPCGNLTPDNPYYRWRVDNVGSDSFLRSQISAAAAGLH